MKPMTQVKGHFDGRVIVPKDARKLKPNQTVTITGEPADPEFGTAAYVARLMERDPLSDEDAELMRRAIEEDCERIDAEPDINFD